MNKRSLLLSLLMITSLLAFSQEVYSNDEYGFSYTLPTDWKLMEYGGLKFPVAIGPVSDNFSANINISLETAPISLKEYVEATITQLDNFFLEYSLLAQKGFKTVSGINGWKILITNTQQSYKLRQIFYIFKNNDVFFVVTCTVVASANDSYDALFDASIKSFRFQ